MWRSKRSSKGDDVGANSNDTSTLSGQSLAASEATTTVPFRARNVQPTGFDVSPEGVQRAAANASKKQPYDTSYMSEEEKAKLRAKGINPELKAQMDAEVYGKKQGKGSGWRGLWRIFSLGNSW